MKSLKWLLFGLPLLGFIAMAFLFFNALGSDPSLLPSARLDQKIPAFELETLAQPGAMVSTATVKGPLLLNVWATWCPSCQLEHPMLLELAKAGIPIVGLNYKDERAAALKYLELHGNPFQYNIFDQKGSLGLDLGVYGAPETYLVDAEGVIRYRHVGVVDPKVWTQVLWPRWQAMGGFDPQSTAAGDKP